MDERLKFVARVLDGEKIAALCREFGISRKDRSQDHQLLLRQLLAVWWIMLGIDIERIKPGNPHQNGRHERMHLTLKL
jgi:putative transposase